MLSERPIRIKSVTPIRNFVVELQFSDGTTREVDLEPFLRGSVFESIRNNRSVFASVTVDERSGTICWENGADIDPDVLYLGLKPAWAESEVAL
jgi:hypothetical protein